MYRNVLPILASDLISSALFPARRRDHDTVEVGRSAWSPKADFFESDGQFEINMDLPGVEAKDLSITVDKRILRISGKREIDSENALRRERISGVFERYVSLPEHADEKKVEAKMHAGVLNIVIKKSPNSSPIKVTVEG